MLTPNDVRQNDYSFPSFNPLFFKLEILKIQDLFKVKIDISLSINVLTIILL